MAKIGLRSFLYAPLTADDKSTGPTYGTVAALAGAIASTFTPDIAEASLYVDDKRKEYAAEMIGGTLSLTIDSDAEDSIKTLLDMSTESVTVGSETVTGRTVSADDTPIACAFAQIVPLMINGAKKYRAQVFYKVKFKLYTSEANTKGESLTFDTTTLEGTTMPLLNGKHHTEHDADTEADALAFITALLS